MSLAKTAPAASVEPADMGRRRTPALAGACWALLVINTIGNSGNGAIIPIPTRLAQVLTMGSLGVAFLLALVINPRVRIRPNGFLFGVSLLVIESFFSSVPPPTSLGSLFRCARLAVFVVTLWLLTPWWTQGLRFARHHIRALGAVLGTVLLGLAVAPGTAMGSAQNGRLAGVIWYLTPPRVAEFAAVVAGLTLMLWLGRRVTGRSAAAVAGVAIAILLLTHTRTATISLVAGLVAAVLTLLLSSARARRTLAWSVAATALAAVGFGTAIQTWLLRGQDTQQLASLTGREKVWDALLAAPRTTQELLFGTGLSNKSFNGLPIDSGWLSVYQEQGLVGVAIVAAIFAFLLALAATRPPSLSRSMAVFLIVYCGIASYTEVGIGDATTYLLGAALAAALLTPQSDGISAHSSGARTLGRPATAVRNNEGYSEPDPEGGPSRGAASSGSARVAGRPARVTGDPRRAVTSAVDGDTAPRAGPPE